MCAPSEIVSKAVVAKQVEDVHTNMFFQMLCHRYITECDLDKHIEGIRDIYRRKCTLMLESLEKYMPDCVKFTRPEGGLFIWCTLPDGIDLSQFIKASIANKVAVVPGTAFNCDTEAPSNAFRLNYSTPSEEQIVNGVRLLGETVKQFLSK
jgi:2-aminoadipate transaminase